LFILIDGRAIADLPNFSGPISNGIVQGIPGPTISKSAKFVANNFQIREIRATQMSRARNWGEQFVSPPNSGCSVVSARGRPFDLTPAAI
jgi:hypothetical protein